MIKRQYHRWPRVNTTNYFHNFIAGNEPEGCIEDELRPYKATLAKSKSKNKMNIKWHDAKLYTLFVMRWSV